MRDGGPGRALDLVYRAVTLTVMLAVVAGVMVVSELEEEFYMLARGPLSTSA